MWGSSELKMPLIKIMHGFCQSIIISKMHGGVLCVLQIDLCLAVSMRLHLLPSLLVLLLDCTTSSAQAPHAGMHTLCWY